jgi:hypothetical protein
MSTRQITDHDYRVILDPNFCYIQDRRTGHLVGTGPWCHDSQCLLELDWFFFLLLRPPFLPVLPSLLHPHRHFLSGIIVWDIFVVLDYLHCFIEVF